MWKTFIHNNHHLISKWNDNSGWNIATIGTAVCCQKDSPFGDHLLKELHTSWRYQKEYKHVDLVIARRDNMRRPYSWYGEGYEQEVWDARFEPILPEILIEQESGCGISWQEMVKLILLRGRLKVLITYTEDKKDIKDETSDRLIHETSDQFKAMLEDAWRECPEFEETEYLLIIGQLDETGASAKANWYCSIFSARGTKVPNEAWMIFST